MNWKNYFKPHILDRGYNYYIEGAVEDFEEEDDQITAVVCGSEDYEVEIETEGGTVQDMYCSCPYAASGEYCKHMAAVLYEWEDYLQEENRNLNKKGFSPENSQKKEKSSAKSETVEDVVAQAPEEIVRKFLAGILKEDEKLFARFKTLLSPELSSEDMKRYKKQVDATIRKYLGRENFITYREARSFIRELEEYLYKDVGAMIDNQDFLHAFELTNYIFQEVGNVDMDDSDGGTGMLAEHCVEIWTEILACADEKTEEIMYQWFVSHLDGSVIDYMEEYLEEILMNQFNGPKYLEAKLAFTEQKVQEARKQTDKWSVRYKATKWALQHIDLMRESGSDAEKIRQYCRENWAYAGIRQYYVDECMECGQYDEAIKVLKESIEMDHDSPGYIKDYRLKLKEIYQTIGDQEAYRKQLWTLVTEDAAGNLELYRELKKLYSVEEWEKVREEIFVKISPHTDLGPFYREEKLYDRLLECVLASPGVYTLQAYEEDLKDKYPDELLQKYDAELNQMAVRTADRGRYREWVDILRGMKKIPGGEEKMWEIAGHWRTMYRNRRAMMEELGKL